MDSQDQTATDEQATLLEDLALRDDAGVDGLLAVYEPYEEAYATAAALSAAAATGLVTTSNTSK